MRIDFPLALDDLGAFTQAYTANRPVNDVPYVCAAAPGILATADLPAITPAGPELRPPNPEPRLPETPNTASVKECSPTLVRSKEN